jgi:hypothetical protein
MTSTMVWEETPVTPGNLMGHRNFRGTCFFYLVARFAWLTACPLLATWLLFNPENGHNLFLRNVNESTPDYTALHPKT